MERGEMRRGLNRLIILNATGSIFHRDHRRGVRRSGWEDISQLVRIAWSYLSC